MKKYLYLLVLVSNIVFAIDKHNLQQKVQQKIKQNVSVQKYGVPTAILGGVCTGIGYAINNGISNGGFHNFSWGALATHTAIGAGIGATQGPLGAMLECNAAIAGETTAGVFENIENRSK